MKLIRNLISRIIILSIIISIGLTLYFIYKNVWQIFVYSKKDLILRKEILVTELKTELFKKIKERLENKKSKEELNFKNLRNPFAPIEKIEIE